MKNLITLLVCFCLGSAIHAQSTYEDSTKLESTIQWLEDRLTYNYYNESDDEWWINRFTFNDESETITIKNIASPHLESVSDKTYLQLNFRLEELNPFTIQIQKNNSNAGRLVKGKVIRVGAYDKSIKRVKNGRLSTNQSFIYISIPAFLEDSLENYSQNIALKLEDAIKLSTKIYNKGTPENNKVLKEMLFGQFTDESGSKWSIQKVFENTYEIRSSNNETLTGLYFLTIGDTLQLNSITAESSSYQTLQLTDDSDLTFSNGTVSIQFISWNEFLWTSEGKNTLLIRDWTADSSLSDD